MKTAMLSMICIGALLTTPVFAQRGDYQAAERKVALCGFQGQRGQRAYLAKKAGQPKPYEKGGSYTDPLDTYSTNYGYDQAFSEKEAHMKAWAYCMDNLDRLARDAH